MPLRPTSRCYRALKSAPTAALVDALWVTDDILNQAFQRFVNVSKAQRRAVSSAPGPMYHRKRFGRRQMTELNAFQSTGILPPWALPNAPDMMDWKWQPPKPELWSPRPSTPPPSPPAPTTTALATLLEAEAPLLDPLDISVGRQARPPHEWYLLHDVLHDVRTNHRGSIEVHADKFGDFLELYRQTMMSEQCSGTAAADVYVTAFKDLEFVARHHLESAKELQLRLISTFASAAQANRHALMQKPNFWDMFVLQIIEFEPTVHTADLLAFGMTHMQTRQSRKHYEITIAALAHFFDLWQGAELHGEPEFWNLNEIRQASCMAGIWCGRTAVKLSSIETKLANGIVPGAGTQASGFVQGLCSHLAIVRACLSRTQHFISKAASLMSNDSAIVERLAIGLRAKDPNRHRVLYTQATRLLGVTGTHWSRAHYNWLRVLASLPKIRTSQFKRNLQLFARRGHAALSHTELCHLLLLHWTSCGRLKLSQKQTDAWKQRESCHYSTVLAELAVLVNMMTPPQQCTGIFWSFWEVLRLRAGPKTFVRQLALLSTRQQLSKGLMQRLAWTCNDARIALLIHQILAHQLGEGDEKNYFRPAFWDKYAARLNTRKNHAHGPSKTLKMLLGSHQGLGPRKTPQEQLSRTEDTPREGSTGVKIRSLVSRTQHKNGSSGSLPQHGQIRRLQMGLMLLKRNRQITTRQAIDLTTRFMVKLANTQGFLAPRDLATLTDFIMRTLDEGRCGSRTRFRWYLGIIRRFLGQVAGGQVDLILKRRRDTNYALWRRNLAIAAAAGAEPCGVVPRVQPTWQSTPWATAFMNRNRMQLKKRRKKDPEYQRRREVEWLRDDGRAHQELVVVTSELPHYDKVDNIVQIKKKGVRSGNLESSPSNPPKT